MCVATRRDRLALVDSELGALCNDITLPQNESQRDAAIDHLAHARTCPTSQPCFPASVYWFQMAWVLARAWLETGRRLVCRNCRNTTSRPCDTLDQVAMLERIALGLAIRGNSTAG